MTPRTTVDRERGFTLIELLVVVIIIGILAAIAVPVFLAQRESSWRATVASDMHAAQMAVESFTKGDGSLGAISSPLTVTDAAASTSPSIRASTGNTIVVTVVGTNLYVITGKNANVSGKWLELASSVGHLDSSHW